MSETARRVSQSFGAARVTADERRALIARVFTEVAPRYDLMNDLMSFGIHRAWKRSFARAAAARPGETVVDLAGGTGDVARLMCAAGAAVIVVDPSVAMLAAGRRRGGAPAQIAAEAERLPFADGAIDCLTIAFGIRNVTRMDVALAEIFRVLAPGGRFLCLEFSRPVAPLRPFYGAWSATVIPALGALVSNSRAAYRYLVQSIARFPDQPEFARLIADAGFTDVRWRNLSLGIAAIHQGRKPDPDS